MSFARFEVRSPSIAVTSTLANLLGIIGRKLGDASSGLPKEGADRCRMVGEMATYQQQLNKAPKAGVKLLPTRTYAPRPTPLRTSKRVLKFPASALTHGCRLAFPPSFCFLSLCRAIVIGARVVSRIR